MSNSSKLWNGDISKWPSFKTDVQMALQREKCGSIIIPFGSRGHVAAIVDRPFPPIQYLGPDGDAQWFRIKSILPLQAKIKSAVTPKTVVQN